MENAVTQMQYLTFIQDIIDRVKALPPDLQVRILWVSGIVVLTWSFRRYLITRSDPVNKNWK